MARQVRGVRAEAMENQRVTFPSSMAPLDSGQIFTVGSMTWVIDLDGSREIMEVVQDHPTPIVPTSTMTSLIPMPHRWLKRSINNNDLIEAIDQVTDHLAEC